MKPTASFSRLLTLVLASAASSQAALTVVTGLELHFDAGSITGLSDGDNVTAWADSSGNSRDLGAAASGTAPTYQSGVLNGLPVVRFTGGGLISSFGTNTFTGGANTVFTVFRSTATTSGTFVSLSGSADNHIFLYQNRYETGDLFASFDASSGDQSSSNNLNGPYNNGAAHIFSTYAESSTVFLRGDSGSQTNSYTDGINTSAMDAVSLGSLNNGNDQRLIGDIAEVLVYSRVLSAGEIDSVESHLTAKYSVVPEPSTALLSVLGLGFALSRRRK